MYTIFYESPLGILQITTTETDLQSLKFFEEEQSSHLALRTSHDNIPIINTTILQLQAYFNKELKTFDLPLAPIGTPFQKQVWQALLEIPFGRTVTYKHIAQKVGKPKGSQAVGNANGKNPIAIIIPCHRVIGADGSLTGYAGGLDRKQWLLDLERPYKQGTFAF